MSLDKRYEDIFRRLGWRYTEPNVVLGVMDLSPDFVSYTKGDYSFLVDIGALAADVKKHARGFDLPSVADRMKQKYWLNAHDPDSYTVFREAESVKKGLEKLADALAEVEAEIQKEEKETRYSLSMEHESGCDGCIRRAKGIVQTPGNIPVCSLSLDSISFFANIGEDWSTEVPCITVKGYKNRQGSWDVSFFMPGFWLPENCGKLTERVSWMEEFIQWLLPRIDKILAD